MTDSSPFLLPVKLPERAACPHLHTPTCSVPPASGHLDILNLHGNFWKGHLLSRPTSAPLAKVPTPCPGPLKPGAKDPPAGAPGSLGHRPPLVGGVETWRRRRDRDTSTEAGRGRGPLLLRSSGLELREGQRTIFSTTVLGVSARPCHLRVAGAPEGPLRGGAGQLPGPRLPERQS